MKKCPFCTGEIPDETVKCMHCGEWLQEKGSATSPEKGQTLNIRVEPTDFQKKVFKTGFVVLAIIFAAISLFIFLGIFFGWLPEWKPMQK
jgi:uncharacterized membrane protein YvbJ